MLIQSRFRKSIDDLFEYTLSTKFSLYSAPTSPEFWSEHIRQTDGREKNFETTKRRVAMTIERMQKQNKCPYCWFHHILCICSKFSPQGISCGNVQLHVLMHAREIAKCANTGRLIAGLFDAPLYIGGHPASQNALDKLFADCSERNLFVLYPDHEALSVSQFLEQVEYTADPCTDKTESIHIIIIDSTWNESKSLQKLIPRKFKRIALDPEKVLNHRSLLDVVRSRTRESGVCSAEAVSLLLRSIGNFNVDVILSLLNYAIGIMKLEKHRPQAVEEVDPDVHKLFVQSLRQR